MINLNITFNYWDNYNEKSLVDNYILFSTDTTIYVKYTKIKIEDDEQSEIMSEFFNFSKLEIVNNFINKRFKQIKQNERLDLSDVIFDLYKNTNVLMSDQLDWEFTGFFKFQKLLNEYVNFIKYMNIDQNTKLVNNLLIKHTKNDLTTKLPSEIINIILMNI